MNLDTRLARLASAFASTAGRVKEVEDLFVVQLHELRRHLELGHQLALGPGLFLPGGNAIEKLFDGSAKTKGFWFFVSKHSSSSHTHTSE